MKDEIKEILEYVLSLTYGNENAIKGINKVKDYITNLQEKVEQYENPEDMTLFYMWLDEKAKDKMKKLQEENNNLKKDFKRHIDRINELTERSDNLQEEKDMYKNSFEEMSKNYFEEQTRNEKANEYNNKNIHSQTLNNILQGSDNVE